MSESAAANVQLKQQVFGRTKHSKHKSTPKLSVFAAYAAVFTVIVSVVAIGYRQPQPSEVASVNPTATNSNPGVNLEKPSVDELVATDVAANLAEQTNMSVAANVANLSMSLAAKTELAQTSDTAISKPQIIQPTASSREITNYTAKTGDTVQSIATAYNISADTVRWANDMSSDAVEPGKVMTIPPLDGVVYTVKAGDTADSIASNFKADKERIVAFNDLEIEGVSAGKKIVVPAGVLPEADRPGYQAPAPVSSFASGGQYGINNSAAYRINSNVASASAGNAYAKGYCTWYAFERRKQIGRPVGSFWGNAATWAMYARAAGFTVNNTPAVGAIMQNGGGYGHVAIVEQVMDNGDVRVSEMNYLGGGGGFNIVSGRTISAGQTRSYSYIH